MSTKSFWINIIFNILVHSHLIFVFFQNSCYKLIHSILVNNSSRDAALNFIQEVLVRNVKRQQIQVNERMVAGDGFMLNFLSVMQHLSSKVSPQIGPK